VNRSALTSLDIFIMKVNESARGFGRGTLDGKEVGTGGVGIVNGSFIVISHHDSIESCRRVYQVRPLGIDSLDL